MDSIQIRVAQKELKRKIFHCASLVYALIYFFLERSSALKLITALFVSVSIVEFGRFLSSTLNIKLVGLFRGIHREEELNRPSGIFWSLLGSLITMTLFTNRKVVLCSMGYLIFGDLVAALVGVKYGKHRLFNKSLEGSISFFGVSMVIGLFFFSPLIALVGSIFATLVEALPLPFSDNFWIPTLSAGFLNWII